MRQRNLVKQIKDAILSGQVKEPFKASDFAFLNKSPSFLSKHCLGNGKYSNYFERVELGQYIILR